MYKKTIAIFEIKTNGKMGRAAYSNPGIKENITSIFDKHSKRRANIAALVKVLGCGHVPPATAKWLRAFLSLYTERPVLTVL